MGFASAWKASPRVGGRTSPRSSALGQPETIPTGSVNVRLHIAVPFLCSPWRNAVVSDFRRYCPLNYHARKLRADGNTATSLLGLPRFRFIPECPAPPPPPQYGVLLLLLALELIGKFEERAIEQRAIVIGKLDQPGFDDESAELDQVTCPFAAPHDPVAGIVPGDGVLKPVPCRHRPRGRAPERRQLLSESRGCSQKTLPHRGCANR